VVLRDTVKAPAGTLLLLLKVYVITKVPVEKTVSTVHIKELPIHFCPAVYVAAGRLLVLLVVMEKLLVIETTSGKVNCAVGLLKLNVPVVVIAATHVYQNSTLTWYVPAAENVTVCDEVLVTAGFPNVSTYDVDPPAAAPYETALVVVS
jgi:hypothetical protein